MAFLGNFLLGQVITFRIVWTPDAGQPAITGSGLTLTHSDGTVLSAEGIDDGAGVGGTHAWHAVLEPTRRGLWHVQWETTPDGGVTDDQIYIS